MARRRPQKKKNSNFGIIIGMCVSGTVLSILVLVMYLAQRSKASDDATSASSEENLVAQTMPRNLPALAELNGSGSDGRELVALINQHKRVLTSGGVDKDDESDAIISEMINAAGGNTADGLLDAELPSNRLTSNDLGKAVEATTEATANVVDRYIDDLEFDRARQAAYAELLFGRAVFENNVRLRVRRSGISLMNHALGQLRKINREAFELGVIDQDQLSAIGEDVNKWASAISAVNDAWKDKLESIDTVDSANGRPNVADLVIVANEDQDRSFRVFATLRLGYAYHERGDSVNRGTIEDALAELKSDDDDMVAEAAEKASEILQDVELYRELR